MSFSCPKSTFPATFRCPRVKCAYRRKESAGPFLLFHFQLLLLRKRGKYQLRVDCLERDDLGRTKCVVASFVDCEPPPGGAGGEWRKIPPLQTHFTAAADVRQPLLLLSYLFFLFPPLRRQVLPFWTPGFSLFRSCLQQLPSVSERSKPLLFPDSFFLSLCIKVAVQPVGM